MLFVCGVITENCVYTTIREASDHSFLCILLEDCSASYDKEFHRATPRCIFDTNMKDKMAGS